ncbi:RAD51-like protein [Planoprotostelium fungivorum]|uniref:RAD51-like protein n=1 Tax=Planoprotostelium fungivorum TaxID=1890364 RepID=A0A2P6N9E5_9EUKA|nr:RAD51-like protein [Planoprotostelium fungivorum]
MSVGVGAQYGLKFNSYWILDVNVQPTAFNDEANLFSVSVFQSLASQFLFSELSTSAGIERRSLGVIRISVSQNARYESTQDSASSSLISSRLLRHPDKPSIEKFVVVIKFVEMHIESVESYLYASESYPKLPQHLDPHLQGMIALTSIPNVNKESFVKEILVSQNASKMHNGVEWVKRAISFSSIMPTGCTALDKYLNGGIRAGHIVELYGKSSTGKTQLCLSLCVRSKHHKILWLDTNNSFSASRLQQMMSSEYKQQQIQERLSAVCVSAVNNVDSLFNALHQYQQELEKRMEQPEAVRGALGYVNGGLVIIDSLGTLLSPLVTPLDNKISQRISFPFLGQSMVSMITRKMKEMTNQYGTVFVCTNYQVKGKNKEERAGLGEYWSYAPDVQINLTQAEDYTRTARLTWSGHLDATYYLSVDPHGLNGINGINGISG